jgi:hypothetical protein
LRNELERLTDALTQQNEIVGRARNAYLGKEAERKHFEAVLIRDAKGKSHAERMINAQATEQWLVFHKDLARLQAVYEFQKFKLEILDKEWLAQYMTQKTDAPVIRRHG